jgi:demethylmenaquinone methyltransferase/2-methoxy-6-polyprenyl-1,4-benzoquinol methylase
MNNRDTWDACASEYDGSLKKVTGPCIVKLLEQVGLLPVTSSSRTIKVIDLACGPGFLGTLLGEAYSQAGYLEKMTILSTDFSSNMVKIAERHFSSRNWPSPQFSARTIDATNLDGVPSACYTHAFCTFGIMMIPDAPKALNEMFRVLEPSGTIGITTWYKLGWMPIYAECLTRAKVSSTKAEDTTVRSPMGREWFETSYVQKVLEDAHFENVHVSIFESRWSFANQDECAKVFTQFWFFKQMLKDANLTGEQREKYDQVVHQVLLDMIGKEPNQPFDLPMIAIIAHGQKPAE